MSETGKPELLATVFSDYICPFCYIGDLRLDRLRTHYALKVNWCLVEIHPETPATGKPVGELGYPPGQWQAMMDNLERLAEEEGVSLGAHDFTTNSRQALLLAEAAKDAGADIFYRLHRRLFEAFFIDGLNIGDATVLSGLAVECGVPRELIEGARADRRYPDRLQRNLAAARALDVRATPTVFFGQHRRVDGVQPYSVFLEAARAGYHDQQSGSAGVE
jgi:predicted DsbA family dithiol-disulfide isomerase